jgi:hypothetical protein
MRLAMEHSRMAMAKKNKLLKESEANTIAESIKAEEDKTESSVKKKKKKKKKKTKTNAEITPENKTQNASKAA